MREWGKNPSIIFQAQLIWLQCCKMVSFISKNITFYTSNVARIQSAIIAYSSRLRSLVLEIGRGRIDSGTVTSFTHTQRQIIMTLFLFDSGRQTHTSPGEINRGSALLFPKKSCPMMCESAICPPFATFTSLRQTHVKAQADRLRQAPSCRNEYSLKCSSKARVQDGTPMCLSHLSQLACCLLCRS